MSCGNLYRERSLTMTSDLLAQKVIRPISTEELERRWKATRDVMKEKGIDFLLIQNNNDYLGGNSSTTAFAEAVSEKIRKNVDSARKIG
jgi:hypothetical protein